MPAWFWVIVALVAMNVATKLIDMLLVMHFAHRFGPDNIHEMVEALKETQK